MAMTMVVASDLNKDRLPHDRDGATDAMGPEGGGKDETRQDKARLEGRRTAQANDHAHMLHPLRPHYCLIACTLEPGTPVCSYAALSNPPCRSPLFNSFS